MSGSADGPKTPVVKYGLSAEEVASDPIVRRHFAVLEEEAAIQAEALRHSLGKLAELRCDGRV